MKLNTRTFRYLTPEDWRVLTAVEVGSKNHEVVPTGLINQLSGLRTGNNGAQKSISTLAKADLIARVRNTRYDGYRLTYGGLDYLALHAHTKSSAILHLGSQMGVGKESDIYLVTSPAPASPTSHLTPSTTPSASNADEAPNTAMKPVQSILKIHRLGRTSFRSLARNRDYHRHRQHCSWQYLSRLSAHKEYAAMCALYEAGFPVPRPIACNRHTIVMSLVPGVPLKDVPPSVFSVEAEDEEVPFEPSQNDEQALQTDPPTDNTISALYAACIEQALRLAERGLIHGDLNEFNILVENMPEPETEQEPEPGSDLDLSLSGTREKPTRKSLQRQQERPMRPHLIDFPQITSLSHPDAADYFARDIAGIKAFFQKRYHFVPQVQDGENAEDGPTFLDARARLEEAVRRGDTKRLDVAIEAAGFSRKMTKELEVYFAQERREAPASDADLDAEDETAIDEFLGEGGEDGHVTVIGEEESRPVEGTDSSRNEELKAGANVAPGASSESIRESLETSSYNDADAIVAAKLASVSLSAHQAPRPNAKAVAGWSI